MGISVLCHLGMLLTLFFYNGCSIGTRRFYFRMDQILEVFHDFQYWIDVQLFCIIFETDYVAIYQYQAKKYCWLKPPIPPPKPTTYSILTLSSRELFQICVIKIICIDFPNNYPVDFLCRNIYLFPCLVVQNHIHQSQNCWSSSTTTFLMVLLL